MFVARHGAVDLFGFIAIVLDLIFPAQIDNGCLVVRPRVAILKLPELKVRLVYLFFPLRVVVGALLLMFVSRCSSRPLL